MNITVLNITSRTVTLKWTRGFDGNSPIKWYRLAYRHEKDGSAGPVFPSSSEDKVLEERLLEGETKEEIVEGDKNQTLLHHLQPVSAYRLWLSAQNEIGSSADSASLAITTLEEGEISIYSFA